MILRSKELISGMRFARFILLGWLFAPHLAHGELEAPIEPGLQFRGIEIPELVDDSTFLRRAYLDAVGRIPTVNEARAFLDSRETDKRSALIDRLLSSEGYAKHWFHFWADLLRVSTEGEITRSGIVGSAYSEWVLNTLRNNVPYDQIVRDLIGRQGNIWEAENAGAVGFYERDFGMPLEHFSNLMRVFTGTRMECAQCHNHPFDRWTQMDFYEMAAFTWSVRAGKYPEVYNEIKGPQRSAINTITTPMRFGSVLPRASPLKLPHDYEYNDAKPLQEVAAVTVFGDIVRPRDGEPETVTFAHWLTSSSNPRFTRVIVNRIWHELFGAPFVPQPLDDLRDGTKAWDPEIEQAAIQMMEDLDYNIQAFIAAVMKSKAYQGKAMATEPEPGEPIHFSGPFLRRMSAEQIWDSLVALSADEPDRSSIKREIYRTRYLADLRNRARRIDGSPDVVRAWLSSAEGKQFVSNRGREHLPEVEERIELFQKQQKENVNRLNRYKGVIEGTSEQFSDWKRRQAQLIRACELDSPAPRGHFLRTFGQSDRLEINNASRHTSVPQSLAMLNSEWIDTVLNPFSPMSRSVAAANSSAERLDTIFLGLLARLPSREERQELERLADSPDGSVLLMSAILVSSEFLFIL